jgi:hypothetical protein
MCSFSNVINQNLNKKFNQMDFWFEFLGIMNEQTINSHHYHGFKWQNINITLVLFGFVCSLIPF